jgi:AcrR family transcriptional regulator
MDITAPVSYFGHRAEFVRNGESRSLERKADRRIERTRKHLLDAFRDLVLERGFARVTIGDVIARANIGRSTFYEHFENKDDILRQSIAPLFEILAATVSAPSASRQLVHLISHFAENARDSRVAFAGRSGRILANFLGELIESQLEKRERANRNRPIITMHLAGRQLAHAQLALIDAWISDDNGCSAESVARALAATTYAAAGALLGLAD